MDLPAVFKNQMQTILAEDALPFFEALEEPSPVSVRLNVRKPIDVSLLPAPQKAPVPWCPAAFYLQKRPSFTFDPLFHAGCYYVQEASSMYLYQVLQQALMHLDNHGEGLKVLDLCAAPGGKSTLLLDALPENSLLVANEVMRHRANVLAENLTKWGREPVIVTQAEAADFAKNRAMFDIILTDVPCSGEGMFRKEPDALKDWSLENVEMCAERQRDILEAVWPALRPGGCLIYSTCTYNRQEDEENVDWLVKQLGAIQLGEPQHFYPHRVQGEGFFIALLQKGDETISPVKKTFKKEIGKRDWSSMLKQQDEFYYFQSGKGTYRAFPEKYVTDLFALKDKMRIVQAGICLGEDKGKDFIPDISMALSLQVNRDFFPTCELDKEQALSYLRGESFALPAGTPKGFVLINYLGKAIGWMKNIGLRANNLYPNEWRIRSCIK